MQSHPHNSVTTHPGEGSPAAGSVGALIHGSIVTNLSAAAAFLLVDSGTATLSKKAALQHTGSGSASPIPPAPVPWKQHEHLLSCFQQLQDSYDALMLAVASKDLALLEGAKRRPENHLTGDAWDARGALHQPCAA